MSRLVEEYGNERAKESSMRVREVNAKRMLESGEFTVEKIANYSGLSIAEVQKLAAGELCHESN